MDDYKKLILELLDLVSDESVLKLIYEILKRLQG